MAQIEVLRALADSINKLGSAPNRKQLDENDSILINDIKVLAVNAELSEFIIARSGIAIGEWITPDQLNCRNTQTPLGQALY